MPRHTLHAAVLTAGLLIAVAATPAVSTAATSQSAQAGGPAGRPVFLVTGEQVSASTGRAQVITTTGGPGQDTGSAGPLETLSQGGATEILPVMAAPYLGQGLARALFEPGALARAESAGRLPLRITYRGGLPALPGVRITSSGDGTAAGYLTAEGARAFGAALARQYSSDHARASYGQDGIFRGVDISLAGRPAAAPVAAPRFPMHTLIVTGTDLAGRPDTGDLIGVYNMDNPARFGAGFDSGSVFYHGTARFSVPAGHYYAVADFCCGRGGTSEHLVVIPQFTVGQAATTTVHVGERSATSRVSITTPRPAALHDEDFTLIRTAANGSAFFQDWGSGSGFALWLSPTTTRPTAGTLQSETQATLTSPSSARGTPYAYRLDFPAQPGTIAAQHFRPTTASLATVHERYYQNARSPGSWCTLGGYVFPDGDFDLSCFYFPLQLPSAQTQYLSAGSRVVWQTTYSWQEGGQTGGYQTYRAGQQVTRDWGAYPLHPQPDVQTLRGPVAAVFPQWLSAFRAGNTLDLYVTPFSDNYPGDVGTGFTGGRRAGVTGSYAIFQNGVRIAHGNPARRVSPVRLSRRPSVIRFTLTARRSRPLTRLSVASATTWTWRTRRQPAATVPAAWLCGRTDRCAVQPMMTLDYDVRGLALDGTTAAGRQVIGLDVGHIQLGGHARITRATAQVSFTSGRTWRPATVTALGPGRFRIAFTARPGAYVTLRTSATDAAGGSVTEIIQRAYQIAARRANGAAR